MKKLKLLLVIALMFMLGSCEVTTHGMQSRGVIQIGVYDDGNYYNSRYYDGYYPNQGYRYHNEHNNTYFFRPQQHDTKIIYKQGNNGNNGNKGNNGNRGNGNKNKNNKRR